MQCLTARDSLSIDVIRRHLDTEIVGRHIYLFGTVPSTDSILRQVAEAGAAEGVVVLAEEQQDGRGRAGTPWFSPDRVNLYISVLFRPPIEIRGLGVFSFIGSLALADAIEAAGIEATIKWPNDVLVGDRKVGGVRVECATDGHRLAWAILGIGVNLNVERHALDGALGAAAAGAGSLREEAGRELDRNGFTASFLNHLEKWRHVFFEYGAGAVLDAWRARDGLRGRDIEVRSGDTVRRGRAAGVDARGYLVLQAPSGEPETVAAGEIKVIC